MKLSLKLFLLATVVFSNYSAHAGSPTCKNLNPDMQSALTIRGQLLDTALYQAAAKDKNFETKMARVLAPGIASTDLKGPNFGDIRTYLTAKTNNCDIQGIISIETALGSISNFPQ